MLKKKGGRRIAIDRGREDVPLPQGAADRAKLFDLFFSFDPLGDDPDAHLFRGTDQAFDDGYADTVWFQVVNEQFVDLDDIDGNGEQVRQRCETRSEIVQRDPYASARSALIACCIAWSPRPMYTVSVTSRMT